MTERVQEALKTKVILRTQFSSLEDGSDVCSSNIRTSWYDLTLLDA